MSGRVWSCTQHSKPLSPSVLTWHPSLAPTKHSSTSQAHTRWLFHNFASVKCYQPAICGEKNMQCLEHTNIQSKSIFRAASWSRWPCAWWGCSSQGPTCSLWTSRLTVLRVYRIYCWSFLLKVNNNLWKYLLQDPIYFPISASGLSTALIVSAPYPYPYNAAPPLYPKLPLGSPKMAKRVSKGAYQFTGCSNQHSLNNFFDLSRCCMRKGHKGKNKKVKWWNGKELQKFPIDRLTEALVTICYFTYRIDKKYLTT